MYDTQQPPPEMAMLFFFSRRRRHTRSSRDWSSDVCSSDLTSLFGGRGSGNAVEVIGLAGLGIADGGAPEHQEGGDAIDQASHQVDRDEEAGSIDEIGRASCRERASIRVVKRSWSMIRTYYI